MTPRRLVIAAIFLLGGIYAILGNIVANMLGEALEPHTKWVLIGFGVTALVLLLYEVWQWKEQRPKARFEESDQRNRQAMLDKVHTIWIRGFLEHSLAQEERLTLGLTATPDAVERPMDILVQRPGQAERPLPLGDPIINEYDAMGGSLLILGAPGAGKTTLLLELLRDLLQRAQDDVVHPIPVVFLLTTWAESRVPIAEWLVDELRKRYEVPSRLARTWVETEQIIPLLDGLDEVAANHRAACRDAINAFRQDDDHGLLPLVVCSRTADYEAVGKRLRLPGAIRIEPLTLEQVQRHLARGGSRLDALRQTLDEDPELWALLDTPLMLSIFTLAYADQPTTVPQRQGDLEARRRQVFAAYVEQMFHRRRAEAPYTPEQTQHSLAWLATQMIRKNLTVFYIEWLQPDWLPKQTQQRLIRTGMRIVIILGVGLPAGLLFGLVVGLGGAEPIESGKIWRWLVVWLVYGLVVGLSLVLKHGPDGRERIDPGEILRWSWSKARHWLVFSLVLGLVFGLYVGLVVGLVYGLVVWLGSGLIDVLLAGLTTDTITTRTIPNEGIRRALRNALYSMLLVGLGNWLVFGLFFGLFFGLKSGLGIGLFFGLGSGLKNGGLNCIQHLLIRLMLVRKDLAPWRYADFLDYAAERILLHKVGGGYTFIHRYLLDYFASLDAAGTPQADKPSSDGQTS